MIQRLFPPHLYERGLRYYHDDRVQGLSFNKNEEAWFAQVEGSESYYVDINVSKLDSGTVKTYCECPAFHTYDTCKHIVAVLLEISDQRTTETANHQITQQFIEGILSSQQTTELLTEKIPMNVEYLIKFDYTNKIWLEIKTGIGHCYVIRNVRDFLNNVLDNKPHFFTNKFTYDPNMHYFLLRDKEILEMLQSFIITGDIYTDREYYTDNAYDKRHFLVPPMSCIPLLELLQERDTTVETRNGIYQEFEVVRDDTPFDFVVTHNENKDLILKIDGIDHSHYFMSYKMVFVDGIFYFPTDDQLKIMNEIKRFGLTNRELPISPETADIFFSEALPILKKNSPVKISDQVADEIVEYPLRAKMYLQKREDSIVGTLNYHYGNYEIDPFTSRNEKEIIIIRDSEKEQLIMNLIEQSNFHYNGKELYIKLSEDEEVYDFLYSILPVLNEYVEVFLTSDIQSLIVESNPTPSTTVNVQTGTNLLEIGFDISGVDEAEVEEMIKAVIEKKRFYRIESGALISLENESFQSMRRFFTDLNIKQDDLQDGSITVPVYRGVQIDELIETKKSYDPSFRKLLHQLQSPEETVFELPGNLQAKLRHYQEVGYQWFKSLSEYHLGGILADDMGLGKTLQTITYLLSEPAENPHLIIVPSSVVYNWRNEFQKFAPSIQVAIISGSPEERLKIMNESENADVWITSYGTVRQDIAIYRKKEFQTMILDEAQFIKNYATKTSKAIREIRALKRFALSGTPIENSIDELWSIFQVVLPGLMPSLKDFRQLGPNKIASLTRPFILRRLKEDVLTELPEKIESVHVSELTKEQKELYVGYLQQLQEVTTASIAANNFQQNRMKILAGLTRLRQLCCHPSLFIENYEGKSGKLEELLVSVEQMIEDGKRMLIFSQFTSMHELIIKELEKRNIDYFYLHGETPSKERVEMSEAFNHGEKSVFLISLRAGGTGLNLTGADTVILYDLWWNPAVEDQAAGRAHRFGQKKVVQVIRFITEGTIEEKIYELQQKKRELIDQVIQPGETMLSSLSEEDVRELLNI